MKMSNELFLLVLIVSIIAGIVIPLAIIWALNTLFPALAIPYTIGTWLAAAILLGAAKTRISVDKK